MAALVAGMFIVYSERALLADVHNESGRRWLWPATITARSTNVVMKRALNALGRVEFELYLRGRQAVIDKTADAEFQFALHTASDSIKEKVDIAVAQNFITSAGIRGSSASRLSAFDREFPWKTDSDVHHVQLSGAEETALKGPCLPPSVRLLYQPSRAGDARAAERVLSQNNFKVDLREVSEDGILDHRQKIYYQKSRKSRRSEPDKGFD
jgi:hypothetical protein